jgi:leucyl aminopeptidase
MPTVVSTSKDLLDTESGAIAILVPSGLQFTPSGKKLNAALGNAIKRVLEEESFQFKNSRPLVYYPLNGKVKRVIAVALSTSRSRIAGLREAAYSAGQCAQQHGVLDLTLAFDSKNADEAQAILEGALLSTYRFEPFKAQKNPKPTLEKIAISSTVKIPDAIRKAEAMTRATFLVRNLVNQPPNLLGPVNLAEFAKKTAHNSKIKVRIFEPPELEKMGAGAFLSVGKGNDGLCRMIELQYVPLGKKKAHVAIVGKGITFDSGGLSLKPEKAMEHMKSDMAGSAIVLATLCAAAELNLPIQMTGLMMAVENMPDGGANRPGDVVTAMNGKTIEITNTDAEGRLALADGLVYAQRQNPDYLFDVATLTGAQVISFGRLIGAAMGNDDQLIRKLMQAGEIAGEAVCQMPLFEPYRQFIKSDTGDIRNSSGIPEAGSIQAGLFLSEFVTHPHWVHFDIAGPSWQEREWDVYSKNGSGFGVRTLLSFLLKL